MKNALRIFLVLCGVWSCALAQRPKSVEIDNTLIKLSFDKSTMTWSLFQNIAGDWSTVLHNASLDLTFRSPESEMLSPEGTDVTSKIEAFSDVLGPGKALNVRIKGSRALWALVFVIYDGTSTLTLQATITNLSGGTWNTKELRLLDARDAAYLQFVSEPVVMHINGYQSWSQSEVVKLDSLKTRTSYWSALFYEADAYRSLLFGFITNSFSTNRFTVKPLNPHDGVLRMAAESDIGTLELNSGKEMRSDRLLISIDSSPHDNLVHYGQYLEECAPQINKPFTPSGKENVAVMDKREVPAGWCSWYYYYDRISEDSIVQNLNFAAKHLRRAGVKYIQIDDGYQIAAGDWDTNRKFPQGHRWLVEQIHDKKLLAGLWVAPFAVAENSSVFKEHPDWLLRDENDSPKVYMTNQSWGGKIYSLDPTIHEVQAWLENLFYTIESYWGYDYVKIDFLYYANDGGKYRVPMTSTQAYQLGLAAIRRGVGSDKFILGCGAPIGSSIGYVDGMRIGNDIYAGWGGITPGASAAACRFFLHGTDWYDDPDCLVVRDPLTMDQARVWASVVALSGQMNILSDKLTSLPPERMDLLKMTLPSYGRSSRPADLFSVPSEEGIQITSPVEGQTIEFPGSWKFSTGDDSTWEKSDFDDGNWKEIPVPSRWEDNGYPAYDGFAWYRVKFSIPAEWKHAPLTLSLGQIDDCDETFLNGARIGGTGTMPPAFSTEWTAFRKYRISEELANWGGENTLAVRVYDAGGPGGIYNASQLRLPRIWNLSVDKPFEKWNVVGLVNWSDEKAKVTGTAVQLNLPPRKTYLLYELWSNAFLGELRNQVSLDLRPTSCAVVTIHEKKRYPIILSTSRHITQGAVDLVDEKWDDAKRSLSVVCENLIDGEYDVVVYAPEGYSSPKIIAPCKAETEQISGNIYKVKLFPSGTSKITWKAIFQ